MFCPKCGAPVGDGVRFCPNCGTPVPQEAASNVPPAPPANGAAAYSAPAAPAAPTSAPAPAGVKKGGIIALSIITAIFIFAYILFDIGIVLSLMVEEEAVISWGKLIPEWLILFAAAVLFIVFCSLLGKLPAALTAIPAALLFAYPFFRFLRSLFSNFGILTNPANAAYLCFLLTFLTFLLFFILAVATKQSAFRVLTVIFGIFLLVLQSVVTVIDIAYLIQSGIGESYPAYAVFRLLGYFTEFLMGFFLFLTMIVIAGRFSRRRA